MLKGKKDWQLWLGPKTSGATEPPAYGQHRSSRGESTAPMMARLSPRA
jgi:hypothetical protein